MFSGVVEGWSAIQNGVDFMSRTVGIIQLLWSLWPWVAVVLVLVIAWNPDGIGDRWIATLRGWVRTAKDAVDGQNERLDAVESRIVSIDQKLDAIAEFIKPKA